MKYCVVRKPPETGHGGFRQVSGKWTKSLVIPALFELYRVKSTRGLELPVILASTGNLPETYRKPTGNLPETCRGGFRQVSGGFRQVSG